MFSKRRESVPLEKLSNGDGSPVKKSWEEILVLGSLWSLKNVLALILNSRNPPGPR
jgi:hypothetical protein